MKIQKISEWNYYQKVIRFIFFTVLLFFALAYLGALLSPDWDVFLEFPILHQSLGYAVIFGISVAVFFLLAIFISVAVEKQTLEQKSKEQEQVIRSLEKDLDLLKRRG